MLADSIRQLEADLLARIAAAKTAEELEAARVAALGRKEGAFNQIAKEMGRLDP